MIYARYADFRSGFALVGAPTAADGFKEFPYTELRAGGFADTLVTNLVSADLNTGFTVTCNNFAFDAVAGVDEFDWYLSQRTDDVASQYFLVQAVPGGSGTIAISIVLANAAKLLPGISVDDYTYDVHRKLLFKNVAIYVQRRSDKAYQWMHIYTGE